MPTLTHSLRQRRSKPCIPSDATYRFLDSSQRSLPRVAKQTAVRPHLILVSTKHAGASSNPAPAPPPPSTPYPSPGTTTSIQWNEVLIVGESVPNHRPETGQICVRKTSDRSLKSTWTCSSGRLRVSVLSVQAQPQRHLFHFTTTSQSICFWHWEPGCIRFAPAIYHREDPRQVIEIFVWPGSAETWARGEDILCDEDDFDRNMCTFRRPKHSRTSTSRLEALLHHFNGLYGSRSPSQTRHLLPSSLSTVRWPQARQSSTPNSPQMTKTWISKP